MEKEQLFDTIEQQLTTLKLERVGIDMLQSLLKEVESREDAKKEEILKIEAELKNKVKEHWDRLDSPFKNQSALIYTLTLENSENILTLDIVHKDLCEIKKKLNELVDDVKKNESYANG